MPPRPCCFRVLFFFRLKLKGRYSQANTPNVTLSFFNAARGGTYVFAITNNGAGPVTVTAAAVSVENCGRREGRACLWEVPLIFFTEPQQTMLLRANDTFCAASWCFYYLHVGEDNDKTDDELAVTSTDSGCALFFDEQRLPFDSVGEYDIQLPLLVPFYATGIRVRPFRMAVMGVKFANPDTQCLVHFLRLQVKAFFFYYWLCLLRPDQAALLVELYFLGCSPLFVCCFAVLLFVLFCCSLVDWCGLSRRIVAVFNPSHSVDIAPSPSSFFAFFKGTPLPQGLSGGEIAGIIIGSLVGGGLLVLAVFCVCRSRRGGRPVLGKHAQYSALK
jgi:hypothetical protein